MTAGPPGWQPDTIMSRIDGWVVDPENDDRIPSCAAKMIAAAMPQPGNDAILAIRRRMYARHKKVFPND
jgi:hypothetical protein